jgi:hypothetical protein
MSIFSHPYITANIRALQSNAAYKLLFVNITSLILPRIYIDSCRNRFAGEETAFYELYSLVTNYGLPGILAWGTAQVLKSIKNPFKIDTTGWIDNKQIRALSHIYQRSIQEQNPAKTLDQFLKNSLAELEGIDSLSSKATRLSPLQIDRQMHQIKSIWLLKKSNKEVIQSVSKTLSRTLGTFDNITLRYKQKNLSINPENFIQHLIYLGTQFQKGHVSSNKTIIEANIKQITQKLNFSNNAKTAVGLTIVSSLGFFAQFINRWLTFRKTGHKGFVGYQDFGQKIKHSSHKNPHQVLDISTLRKNLHFGGMESSQFLPTSDQLKCPIYPMGILGKLLASRDWIEARETAIKATFAYFNFLFIPNLVENLVAHKLGNQNIFSNTSQFKHLKPSSGLSYYKQWFQNVNQSRIRSFQDIEIYSKRLGEEIGKLNEYQLQKKLEGIVSRPMPILKRINQLGGAEKVEQLSQAIAKELNGLRNIAIISSLLYSCLTLGIGLNLLNIYITNSNRTKRRHEEKPIATPPAFNHRTRAYSVPFRYAPERMVFSYASTPFSTRPWI